MFRPSIYIINVYYIFLLLENAIQSGRFGVVGGKLLFFGNNIYLYEGAKKVINAASEKLFI